MLNLFIFNHINKNETIKALLKYKRTHAEADYCEAARGIIEFAPKRLTNKNILGEFVLRLMLESEHLPDISRLRDFLRHDVKVIFSEFINYDWEDMFRSERHRGHASGMFVERCNAVSVGHCNRTD